MGKDGVVRHEDAEQMRGEFYPPRGWWLKRIVVGLVALVVIVGVVHRVWWVVAERRYQGMVREAHARGEPILPEDFDWPSSGPDEKNAVQVLMEAVRSFELNPTYEGPIENDPWNLTAESYMKVRATIDGNGKSIRLIRAARRLPTTDWWGHGRWREPDSWQLGSSFNYLGRVLAHSAKISHDDGDDRAAFETILDVLNMAMILHRAPGTAQEQTGADLIRTACQVSDEFSVHGFKVQPRDGQRPGLEKHATREQVRELIAMFVNDARYRASSIRAWQARRMAELEEMRSQVTDDKSYNNRNGYYEDWYSREVRRIFGPLMELDGIRGVEVIADAAKGASQSNWQSAMTLVHRDARSDISNGIEMQFESETERHVAALRLAIRMFRVDHADAYPEKLSDLSPEYLHSLPTDPFAADDRPLTYRKAPTPLVYSLSHNGTDENGSTRFYKGWWGRPGIVAGWDREDAVFPLDEADIQRKL